MTFRGPEALKDNLQDAGGARSHCKEQQGIRIGQPMAGEIGARKFCRTVGSATWLCCHSGWSKGNPLNMAARSPDSAQRKLWKVSLQPNCVLIRPLGRKDRVPPVLTSHIIIQPPNSTANICLICFTRSDMGPGSIRVISNPRSR
jgi:hypothetical protein